MISVPTKQMIESVNTYRFAIKSHIERISFMEKTLMSVLSKPNSTEEEKRKIRKFIKGINRLKIEVNRFSRLIHEDIVYPDIVDLSHSSNY